MKILILLLLFVPIVVYSQNKKEQIALLNKSIDSLNNLISENIDNKRKETQALNTIIESNEIVISQLLKKVSSIQALNSKLSNEIEQELLSRSEYRVGNMIDKEEPVLNGWTVKEQSPHFVKYITPSNLEITIGNSDGRYLRIEAVNIVK
jgi:chromosome condensin MukBEF ATPase and DNA-binding subunit MukB